MSNPKKTFEQGLAEGKLDGIELFMQQLREYRVLVTAVSEGEQLTESNKERLFGGVAAIESMLEIGQKITDLVEEGIEVRYEDEE